MVDEPQINLLTEAFSVWGPNLNEIYFMRCSSLGEPHLELLNQLPAVTSVALMECHGVDDFHMRAVAKNRNLRKLQIFDCPLVTDGGLGYLRAAGSLQELHLSGEMKRITPNGVRALKQHLPLCKITDAIVRW